MQRFSGEKWRKGRRKGKLKWSEGRKEGEGAGVVQISVSHFWWKHISTSTCSNHRSKISKACVSVTFTIFKNIGFRTYKLYSSLRTTISAASESQLLRHTYSALQSGNSCMDKCCVPQNISTK
jgi:hypothetical protein